MSTKTEKAWAAGFFDGEGNVRSVGKTGLMIQIFQCDKEVLCRIQAATSVGRITGPYTSHHRSCEKADGYKRRPQYLWAVCNRADVMKAIGVIKPWLGSVKLEQARKAGINV